MRIVILTQNYPPEVGATAVRLHRMATSLVHRGHQVTVITAMPSYPTGRTYDGYRGKVRSVEELDGIRVVRTWAYPSKSLNSLLRFTSYATFALSSLLLGVRGLGRQDIVLFETPPLPLVPTGLAIGRFTRASVIMNVSDIWPEMAIQLRHRVGGPTMWVLKLLERIGYEKSDLVTTTTRAARDRIRQRFPHVRTAVISNGVDLRMFDPALRSQGVRDSLGAGPEDFLVSYIGLHGLFQGLEVVIEAADKLRGNKSIKFAMIGDGPLKDELRKLALRKKLNNLQFLDPLEQGRIPSILASCDAALVPLAAEFPSTMPSKVYEAMASGVPVLITKGCEGARVVEKANAGRTFPPMDPDELAEALVSLAANREEIALMKNNCRELAERWDYDRIAIETEETLQAVTDGVMTHDPH